MFPKIKQIFPAAAAKTVSKHGAALILRISLAPDFSNFLVPFLGNFV